MALPAQTITCGPLPPSPTPAALSAQQEQWLWDAEWDQMGSGLEETADPALEIEAERVLARLRSGLPPKAISPRVSILLAPAPNAINMSAGHIFITRSLISEFHDEDELAGVLAHELGHEYLHSGANTLRSRLWNALRETPRTDPAGFLSQYNRLITWSERHPDQARDTDRDQEAADRAAITILAHAGYSVQAFPDAFERATGAQIDHGGWLSWLRHTPPDVRRLRAMLADQVTAPSCLRAPILAPTAFRAWQARLIVYQPPTSHPASLPGLIRAIPLSTLRAPFRQLHFSPDGRYILAVDPSGVWILKRRPLAVVFHIAETMVATAGFSPDSLSLVFSTTDGRVERWEIASQNRTLINQIVPALPGCSRAEASPDGRFFVCANSDNVKLFDTSTGDLVFQNHTSTSVPDFYSTGFGIVRTLPPPGLAFSPDGRYLVVHGNTGGWALDLSTRRLLSLSGPVRALINSQFTFLPNGHALGTSDPGESAWQEVTFPEGQRIHTWKLGPASIQGESHGPMFVVRPFRDSPAAIFDPLTGKALLTDRVSDLDGYDGDYLTEDKRGAIQIFRLDGTQARMLSQLTLPVAPLNHAIAATASSDLSHLAVSIAGRGAIWSLRPTPLPAAPVYIVPPFDSAWLHDDSAWLDLSQTPPRIPVGGGAGPVTTAIRLDLQTGHNDILPPWPNVPLIENIGRQTLACYVTITNHHLQCGARDTQSEKPLWLRDYKFSEHSGAILVPLASQNQVGLLYLATSDSLDHDLRSNPGAERRLAAIRDKASAAWFQIVDAQTGKPEQGFLLDPAPSVDLRPSSSFVLADTLYVADGENRLIRYSTNGHIQNIWFGRPTGVNSPGGEFLLQPDPWRLDLYASGAATPLRRWAFPTPVIYATWDSTGARFLVLTQDQTAYLLAPTDTGASAGDNH